MDGKKVRPQDKWNQKAGLVSKSYKLRKSLVDEFARACEKAGVSQASQITRMMQEFIRQQDDEEN